MFHNVCYLEMIVIIRNLLLSIVFISFSTISNANEYQKNYAINVCQKDMQQFKASGLSTAKYLKFCVCYMSNMVDALDEKEDRYQQKYKKPSGKYIRLAREYKKECTK